MKNYQLSSSKAWSDQGVQLLHTNNSLQTFQFVNSKVANVAKFENQYICNYFVSVFSLHQRDTTPLHMAAEGGHTNILRYLLDKGAAIDIKNVLGVSTNILLTTAMYYKLYCTEERALNSYMNT